MAHIITSDSIVTCDHQGTVTAVPTAVAAMLQVAGAGALVGNLAGSKVADCMQTGPNTTPCQTVLDQTSGPSTVLFVGEQPVLLTTAAGTTQGSPTKNWSVTEAVQDVLTAD